MALKLQHDPAADDVCLPKAETLYLTNCQQMSLHEIDRPVEGLFVLCFSINLLSILITRNIRR